jgi:hypothetical protein
MEFTKTLLRETRSVRGAFSGISRAFDDIDKAVEAGDLTKARVLLRRIQIALESLRRDETPHWRVDKDRSIR